MTTDYPESHEITFKEITTAASSTSPRSFISQTHSGHLRHREAEQRAVRLCPLSPPLPSPPVFVGCLGISRLTLLQGYVKIAVMWKSRDTASKRLEMRFELRLVVLPPSLHPSRPAAPSSSPTEIGRILGELQNFHTQHRIKLQERKEEVCKLIWENGLCLGKEGGGCCPR